MRDETAAEDRITTDAEPHARLKASAEVVRDVSGAAERTAGDSIEELATGLDRAAEQPAFGREGQ